MSVIVNGKTASASEIVSGALQDHDRATDRRRAELRQGSGAERVIRWRKRPGLALTTALYYIPSGRSIQKTSARSVSAETICAGRDGGASERAHRFQDRQRPARSGRRRHSARYRGDPRMLTPFRDGARSIGSVYDVRHRVYPRSQDHRRLAGAGRGAGPVSDVACRAAEFSPLCASGSRAATSSSRGSKTEIYNLALGVEKGDEVEAQSDPQIQKALEAVLQIQAGHS